MEQVDEMFRKSLYSSRDIPQALEMFEKKLIDTEDISNIAHAAKIKQYRLLMKNKRFLSTLRKNFNEIYNKITSKYPDIRFVIEGRRKSLISFETKVQKNLSENKSLDLIRDTMGLRIILFGETSQKKFQICYEIMELIITYCESKGYILCEEDPIPHHSIDEIPNGIILPKKSGINPIHQTGIKDYLMYPKSNGYQSLHSVFRTVPGECFEIQIRTMEQHIYSESDIANHDEYKKSKYGKKIDIDYSKINIPGFKCTDTQLFDFIGLEKSLLVLQRNKTF